MGLKILHITFHIGCSNALKSVFSEIPDIELTTDIVTSGRNGYYYNMTHNRANEAWALHRDYYNKFDVIVASDTAPLSRIFLQNDYKGKLITWVSNRFDYADSREKGFPDIEYYHYMKTKYDDDKKILIVNCKFESFYAWMKKNVGIINNEHVVNPAQKPYYRDKGDKFYVPTYSNDKLLNLSFKLNELGIEAETGRYEERKDLAHYKGIIHAPYTWNSIALWDALACGVPYIVPDEKLMAKWLKKKGYWHQNADKCEAWLYRFSEFYNSNNDVFVKHFSGLEQIKDIEINHNEIYSEAEKRYNKAKEQWGKILEL